MTIPTLNEMAALEAAATPGPWTWEREKGIRSASMPESYAGFTEGIVQTDGGCYGPEEPDGQFIAAAREFVPWAIARIRKLEAYENTVLEAPSLQDTDERIRKLHRRAQLAEGLIARGVVPEEEIRRLREAVCASERGRRNDESRAERRRARMVVSANRHAEALVKVYDERIAAAEDRIKELEKENAVWIEANELLLKLAAAGQQGAGRFGTEIEIVETGEARIQAIQDHLAAGHAVVFSIPDAADGQVKP